MKKKILYSKYGMDKKLFFRYIFFHKLTIKLHFII